MNSVFIVDDESLVIKSLKSSIDWNRMGYEVIGEAGNGIDAYEKILRLMPDIVFTDIRMPGLSGLELIKKVNDVQPNIQFVVMSGYAEFVYVQKALSYGALGYCLKPFDEVEIESVLKRANNIIRRNKWSIEMELLLVINDMSEYGSSRRKELIKQLGYHWEDNESIYVVVSQSMPKIGLIQGARTVSFKIGKSRFAQLIPASVIDEFVEKLKELDFESIGSIGVSFPVSSDDKLSEAIEQASLAMYQYFIAGRKFVYLYSDKDKNKINDKLVKLRNYIAQGDITETIKLLDSLEIAFTNGEYNIINAFQVYNIIMYYNVAINNSSFEELLYNYEQLINMFSNFKEMLAFLKSVIKQSDLPVQGTITDVRNENLRNILEYVGDYFGEDISIQSISKKFNVNPSYLSQLFKKDTGMTFTDYMTDLRIKNACLLLKNTALSVNEVAEKVGFNDYYYFTRVFKKVTGSTPSQYRENIIF